MAEQSAGQVKRLYPPSHRQKRKLILKRAAPELRARFRVFNIRALHALQVYNTKEARRLMHCFQVDMELDGLAAAMEKWQWLIN